MCGGGPPPRKLGHWFGGGGAPSSGAKPPRKRRVLGRSQTFRELAFFWGALPLNWGRRPLRTSGPAFGVEARHRTSAGIAAGTPRAISNSPNGATIPPDAHRVR